MNLGDPRVVEIAGLAGADAVWLCNEHVPNDWQRLGHRNLPTFDEYQDRQRGDRSQQKSV
jgi:2-keto-3-deoxy-L-rhamnonate aldolase RhmA